MSDQFQVKFVLSVSKSENDLPESIRKYITISYKMKDLQCASLLGTLF